MVDKSFHGFPRIEQSHVVIVNDVAGLIPRILIVTGLECKRSMNEIEIQVRKPESL